MGLTGLGVAYIDNTTLHEDLFEDLSSLENLSLHKHSGQTAYLARGGLSLPEDIFDVLSSSETFNILSNRLSSLPAGLFEGLSDLTEADFLLNPGGSFTLASGLEASGDSGVVGKVAEGVPFDMSVTLSANEGAISATTVTFTGGNLKSSAVTVTPSGAGGLTANVGAASFTEGSSSAIRIGLGDSWVLQNSPATGGPTIRGSAQVGRTLTGGTTGISYCDGLTNVSYSHQWLADDATSSTYTVQPSDNGKVIKVRVTFTDDQCFEESLSSVGTAAVVVGEL